MPKKARRKRCGAKTRSGSPCQLLAGQGTNHPGYGRCKHHGGSTPNGQKAAATEAANAQKPVEELIVERDLRDLVAELKRRGDITDLSEDLALARAVAINFINRVNELETALLRWSASWDKDWVANTGHLVEELQIAQADEDWERYGQLLQQVPDPLTFLDRPRKVIDLGEAVKMLKDVSSIVHTIVQHQEAGAIPARDVEVLLVEIAAVCERTVREHVGDVAARAGLLASLERAFAEIRLSSWNETGDGDGESLGDGRGRRMDA